MSKQNNSQGNEELVFEPYEHPPAPVMTERERIAWMEPSPPQIEADQRLEEMHLAHLDDIANRKYGTDD